MAWILTRREKRALIALLEHSPGTTFDVAFGMGIGSSPDRQGITHSQYEGVRLLLLALMAGGAAFHSYRSWEITEKGRIAAALTMFQDQRAARHQRVAA
ncbi:hypothetical protein ABIB86_000383 [Bradyrhizobium sp. JR1.7]|uniref:hypothetical protein n=1 Tax=unclassified Bradyrhizobium TaxID=2631580 RepID=UPI0033973C86